MRLNLQTEYDSIDYDIANDVTLKYAMKTIMYNLRELNNKHGDYHMPTGFKCEFAENIVEDLSEDISLEIETMRAIKSFVGEMARKTEQRLDNLTRLETSMRELGYSPD